MQLIKPKFGASWDIIGSHKYSETRARVGGIRDHDYSAIGLSAMQLTNIGCEYGQVEVSTPEFGEKVPVFVYNAYGGNSFRDDNIWISRSLAEKLDIDHGDELTITRAIDEQGRIIYSAQNQRFNRFGREWGRLPSPVNAIVAAIDSDGHNTEMYRIGFTAMQIDNLNVQSYSEPLNTESLPTIIQKNSGGWDDGRDFGTVNLEYEDQIVSVPVYNSFGMRAIGGCGVRISSILADDLGVELGDRIKIYGHTPPRVPSVLSRLATTFKNNPLFRRLW